MSNHPSFGRKMNLKFIAEHTVDRKTFFINRKILQVNPPILQEMSEVKIGRGDLTVWRCPKQQEVRPENRVFLKIKA